MSSKRHPQVVHTIAELRQAVTTARAQGRRVGLVPTMGALHAGHLSLVEASMAECDYTVATIYVNPSQFGPGEDLEKYPRTLESDLDALGQCGADLAFVPNSDEVYRANHATWIEVGAVAEPLEGECRPGHFRGVATIVLKLLNMATADVAFFGQKDFQQFSVIRQMVEDLNVPTKLRMCPIVRESDGLAMSSRNAYLSPAARHRALVLWQSLQLAAELVAGGELRTEAIAEQMRNVILTADDARIDYIALVDPDTLQAVDEITGPMLAALAVKIENTRLIDNVLLEPKE